MNTQIHVLYPKRAMLSGSPVASQSLTVSTTAVAATGYTAAPAVNGVDLVTFDVQTNDVNARWDGTDPTAGAGGGHLLPAGTAYTWDVDQFNNAKFIRVTAAAADAKIFSSAMMA